MEYLLISETFTFITNSDLHNRTSILSFRATLTHKNNYCYVLTL